MPGAVLLRVCGVPVETALAAGNPALFAEAADLRADLEAHASQGLDLAAALQRAINSASLEREAARRLGAAASRLARGLGVGDLGGADPAWAAAVDLLPVLRAHEARRETLAIRARDVEARLADEPARAALALWTACRDHWGTTALLRHADGAFLERCRAAGDEPGHWRGKDGRHRAAHLLGIVHRAAFRTVPRGWYVQVAALALGDDPAGDLTVEPDVAAIWAENLHALERDVAAAWSPRARGQRLALAPIRRRVGDRLAVLVTDRDDPREVREVSLRVDPLLGAIAAALGASALSPSEVRRRVARRVAPGDGELLEGVLAHLVRLGIVRVARSPRTRVLGWARDEPARRRVARAVARLPGRPAYLDVYGRVGGALRETDALSLQDGFTIAARLALAIERDAAAGGPASGSSPESGAEEAEVPLLEAVHARILAASGGDGPEPDGRPPSRPPRGAGHWTVPSDPQGPYGRLHAWIASRLGRGDGIEVGEGEMAEAGVAPWALRWPVDAMVRPAGPRAGILGVLDEAFPAGSMDARFVDGGERLGLPQDQYRWYRRFLGALDRRGEHLLVELAFPPLSLGAANAVRRPVLVSTWTGDAATASHLAPGPDGSGAARFLPLDRFRLRIRAGATRLWAEGRPVLPFYHATRLPVAPWSVIAEMILGAAPPRMRWSPRRLHRLLDAFPGAERAPRLQTRSGLVLSCAQWRLPRDLGWHPRDRSPAKAAALAVLRRRLDLPRVVFLSPGAGHRPVPCDLDSVWAIPAIEAARAAGVDLLAIEMTPAPPHVVPRERDEGGRRGRLTCALLRFPLNASPEAFAEEVAPGLR